LNKKQVNKKRDLILADKRQTRDTDRHSCVPTGVLSRANQTILESSLHQNSKSNFEQKTQKIAQVIDKQTFHLID
jgi:hypothetical protein